MQISRQNRDRMVSATAVGLFHAALGYVLITSFGFQLPAEVTERMKMFDVTEEPPPPPAEPPPADEAPSEKRQTKDPEGAASPANLKDTPSPIMAPKPKIVIPIPPPVVAAPAAGQGNAPAAGAANVPGPGTGSGGIGTGLGSGLFGNGTGGGGGGRASRARHIAGGIYDGDYPPGPFARGIGGTVYLRFVVQPNGRVSNCRVTRSSGNRDLDTTTCRLIERRFRYRPALDPSGRAVPETVIGQHEWEAARRPDVWMEATIPED
ncbi:MAG TPA: energy transducer TonB [Allosphingosinicella sp.]|uniref:energy transducer TonB n=1 Tax=Allosphingosinicella sp. TaxID=2823234 RepID=UPI002ED97BA1